MEDVARRLVTNILGETFGLEEAVARQATALLVMALDAAGLVIMPVEPTGDMVQASMTAMRRTRTIRGGSADEIQEIKHTIRYRAMVEKQRGSLGLAKDTRNAVVKRAKDYIVTSKGNLRTRCSAVPTEGMDTGHNGSVVDPALVDLLLIHDAFDDGSRGMDSSEAFRKELSDPAVIAELQEMLAEMRRERDQPRVPASTVRAVLKTLRWTERTLAEALGCEEAQALRWTAGSEGIPDRVSEWLEVLATWHVQNPPPERWETRHQPDVVNASEQGL